MANTKVNFPRAARQEKKLNVELGVVWVRGEVYIQLQSQNPRKVNWNMKVASEHGQVQKLRDLHLHGRCSIVFYTKGE